MLEVESVPRKEAKAVCKSIPSLAYYNSMVGPSGLVVNQFQRIKPT